MVASSFIVAGLSILAIGVGLLALWTLYPDAPPVPTYIPPSPGWNDDPNPSVPPGSTTPPDGPGSPDDPDRDSPAVTGNRKSEEFYTFLILGMDDGTQTDTIMVAGFDTINNKLGIVSIPRDSQRDVTHDAKKINAAHLLGLQQPWGGPENAMRAVADLIGFRPDYYIVVNLDVMGELIDIVAPGGIEFDVPINMHWTDPAQDPPLRIFFDRGVQKITGDQAKLLMRYRQNNMYHVNNRFTTPTGGFPDADIGRIRMQQNFMRAIAKHTLTLRNISNIPRIVNTVNDNLAISEELNWRYLSFFAKELLELNEEDITFARLDGDNAYYSRTGQAYIWLHDDHRNLDVINELINPYKEPVTKENLRLGRYGTRQP